jgi:ketosteroid isomerase-like protein
MDASRSSPEQQVLACERDLYRAQIAGDVAALRPMLSTGLVYIHSTGIAETAEEYLAGVRDKLYEYGMIETRETRLRVFADLAIMNGIVDMTVSAHGAPKQLIHLLFCLTWIRQDGAWRLDFRQATRMHSENT